MPQGRLRIALDPGVEEDLWNRYQKKQTIREIARAVGESTWVVWTRLQELKSQRDHLQPSKTTRISSEEVAGAESPSEPSKQRDDVETKAIAEDPSEQMGRSLIKMEESRKEVSLTA